MRFGLAFIMLPQYFLELMKVPRVESKMRVFSFKIQFSTQVRFISVYKTLILFGLIVNNDFCADYRIQEKFKCGNFCVCGG